VWTSELIVYAPEPCARPLNVINRPKGESDAVQLMLSWAWNQMPILVTSDKMDVVHREAGRRNDRTNRPQFLGAGGNKCNIHSLMVSRPVTALSRWVAL